MSATKAEMHTLLDKVHAAFGGSNADPMDIMEVLLISAQSCLIAGLGVTENQASMILISRLSSRGWQASCDDSEG